jgi:hypothetical protein
LGDTYEYTCTWERSRPRPSGYVLLKIAVISSAFLGGLIAVSSLARPRATTPGVPQLVDTSGQSYFANAHPYLEEPLEKLIERIPELRTLQPAPDQQALPIILEKTGVKVQEFFQNIVDLTAHEVITQERLNAKETIIASRRLQYNYLILIHRNALALRVEEYRTNLQGNRAEPEGLDKGFSVTSGFALKWIHFQPKLRSDSTFLYLGRETMGARNTYVVAFAQRPGQATVTSTVGWSGGTVPILVQGIAWVDQDSFQVIRIRTDLLAPRNDIGLTQQTTDLTLSEVKLPDLATPLWLPRDVNVYSVFKGRTFRNKHRYADYQRFRVSIKIGPPKGIPQIP